MASSISLGTQETGQSPLDGVSATRIPGNTSISSDGSGGVYIMSIANTISSKQSLLIIPIVKFFNVPDNLIYLIRVLNSEVFGIKSQKSGSPISLRLIDWFVTNYCKKNNIMYNIVDYRKKDGTADNTPSYFENLFFVHDNYKSQLKECSKKHFDPFCRRNRVRFYFKPNAYFKTTVGQLNFFKWALENHVIDYIREHLDEIEKDMNDSIIITPPVPAERKIEKATKKRTTSESGSIGANSGAVASSAMQATTNATATAIASAQLNPILAELAPKTKSHKKTTSRQKRKELSSSANKSFTKYSIPTTLTFD